MVTTVIGMQIEFDAEKRDKTLAERGLDFVRASELFGGRHLTQKICVRNTQSNVTSQSANWMAGWSSWSGHHAARRAASSA